MLIAAARSKLEIPGAIYNFCVFMLLMRIGLDGGMETCHANLADMLLPAAIAMVVGLLVVLAGSSSGISGPPTVRAAIPSANPATYLGASTSVGTPVAIAIGTPLFIALGQMVFGS